MLHTLSTFLGIWEEMYNPNFNSPEFEGIKNEAGLNRFIMSVKQWIAKTNAIGIIAKAARGAERGPGGCGRQTTIEINAK